jgi:hypothetical protein
LAASVPNTQIVTADKTNAKAHFFWIFTELSFHFLRKAFTTARSGREGQIIYRVLVPREFVEGVCSK